MIHRRSILIEVPSSGLLVNPQKATVVPTVRDPSQGHERLDCAKDGPDEVPMRALVCEALHKGCAALMITRAIQLIAGQSEPSLGKILARHAPDSLITCDRGPDWSKKGVLSPRLMVLATQALHNSAALLSSQLANSRNGRVISHSNAAKIGFSCATCRRIGFRSRPPAVGLVRWYRVRNSEDGEI